MDVSQTLHESMQPELQAALDGVFPKATRTPVQAAVVKVLERAVRARRQRVNAPELQRDLALEALQSQDINDHLRTVRWLGEWSLRVNDKKNVLSGVAFAMIHPLIVLAARPDRRPDWVSPPHATAAEALDRWIEGGASAGKAFMSRRGHRDQPCRHGHVQNGEVLAALLDRTMDARSARMILAALMDGLAVGFPQAPLVPCTRPVDCVATMALALTEMPDLVGQLDPSTPPHLLKALSAVRALEPAAIAPYEISSGFREEEFLHEVLDASIGVLERWVLANHTRCQERERPTIGRARRL